MFHKLRHLKANPHRTDKHQQTIWLLDLEFDEKLLPQLTPTNPDQRQQTQFLSG